MQLDLTQRQLEFLLRMFSNKNHKFDMPNVYKKKESFLITAEDRHAMHGLHKKLIKLHEENYA